MNTCSFTIHFKIINACSKMSVKCIICFGEFEETFSFSFSFQSTPLTPKVSPNTKKLKRVLFHAL